MRTIAPLVFRKVALVAAAFTLVAFSLSSQTMESSIDPHQGEDEFRYFRDEGDGGDDPLAGGCHYKFTDPACTLNKRLAYQDECLDRVTLLEWTDTTCHSALPLDTKTYDCDAECIVRGFRLGRCSYRNTGCPLSGGGLPPAQCICWV
jgi:hypothetical protein